MVLKPGAHQDYPGACKITKVPPRTHKAESLVEEPKYLYSFRRSLYDDDGDGDEL